MLRTIPYAQTRTGAERLRTEFTRWCRDHSYEAACVTLERDWDRMITFYDFPKEHWQHLRTTNPVESPFAALRLRTDAAKRYKRVDPGAIGRQASSVLSKPNRPYPGSATASWCPPDSERHSRSWQRHRGEPRCRHGRQRDRWSRARRTGSDDRDRPGTRRREIDHGSRE